MAMALTGYSWGVSSFQSPVHHLRRFTDTRTARIPRRLQVACEAQSSKASKSFSVSQRTKKKKLVKRKKDEKPKVRENEDKEGFAIIPQMSEWLNSKPSGFGVAKEYNTSVEEDLLVDIKREEELRAAAEARRKEMAATGKKPEKKKTSPVKREKKVAEVNGEMTSKKEEQKGDKNRSSKPMPRISLHGDKVVERKSNTTKLEKKPLEVEEEPAGFKVKLTHLPKKKNIRRDLRELFKDVQGLLLIKPNELASRKTRDPICKGSAHLTFADMDTAKFFVKKFRGQKLQFGKVGRILKFELLPEKVEAKLKEEVQKPVPPLRVCDPVAAVSPPKIEAGPGESEAVTEEELASNSLNEHETETEDELVLEAIVSASMDEDEDTENESLEEDDGEEDDEDYEDEEEDDDFEMTLKSVKADYEGMELSDELEYVDSEDDDDDEYSDEDDEEDDEEVEEDELESPEAGMEVSDGDTSDEEESTDEVEQESESEQTAEEVDGVSAENYLEVDVSQPLTVNELGGTPEEIIYRNTEKMAELDKEISLLKKKLKRRKSKALEAKIMELRDEKIELLEKRVLARFVVAREAYRVKRAKKQEEKEAEKTKRNRKLEDEKLKDVVSRHFTSQS